MDTLAEQMKICPQCEKPAKRFTKGVCHNCYRRTRWEIKEIECKRCGERKPHQAFGLCRGCYNSIFHIEKAKEHNHSKTHDLNPTMYDNLTQKYEICGFDKVVELHHIDGDHKNFSVKNLVGLCPNHHAMAEDRRWKFQILDLLREKNILSLIPLKIVLTEC
jgi:hypothetical protein